MTKLIAIAISLLTTFNVFGQQKKMLPHPNRNMELYPHVCELIFEEAFAAYPIMGGFDDVKAWFDSKLNTHFAFKELKGMGQFRTYEFKLLDKEFHGIEIKPEDSFFYIVTNDITGTEQVMQIVQILSVKKPKKMSKVYAELDEILKERYKLSTKSRNIAVTQCATGYDIEQGVLSMGEIKAQKSVRMEFYVNDAFRGKTISPAQFLPIPASLVPVNHALTNQNTVAQMPDNVIDSASKMTLYITDMPRNERILPMAFVGSFCNPCIFFEQDKCAKTLDSLFTIKHLVYKSLEAEKVRMAYGIKDYPFFLVVDTSGEKLIYATDVNKPPGLNRSELMDLWTTTSGKQQLKAIENLKVKGDVDKETLYKALKLKDSVGLYDRELWTLWAAKLSEKDLKDPVLQKFIVSTMQFMRDSVDDDILDKLTKNIDPSIAPYDDEKLSQRSFLKTYSYLFLNTLAYYNNIEDTTSCERIFKKIESFSLRDSVFDLSSFERGTIYSSSQRLKILYYKGLNQAERYCQALLPFLSPFFDETKRYDDFSPEEKAQQASALNNMIWGVWEVQYKDKLYLANVLKAADAMLQFSPNMPEFMDTKAHILLLSGEKQAAIDLEKQAIAILDKVTESEQMSEMGLIEDRRKALNENLAKMIKY
jgi:hypothetical protein